MLRAMGDRVSELEHELERMQAKVDALTEELEEARHYRNAVEGSPIGIMSVSAAKGRYAFVNEAFAQLLGSSREELLASDPYEIWMKTTHADDVDPGRAAMGRVAKGEIDGFHLDKQVIPLRGDVRWVTQHAFASRDDAGRMAFLTAFFTDTDRQRALIVAQERLEAELHEAQKLGAVGKLAGGIAHDFNNRLVIVMGYAELIKRGLPPDSALASHVDMVLASAKRAAELTRQLLAYGRRQVLKPEAFDLNEVTERARSLLQTVLGGDVELVTALGAKCGVVADPGQIEQVILNLALNARDAMPEGGTLRLETREVTFAAGEHEGLSAGAYGALVVSDSGTGIPADVLPHVFEPFFTTKEIGQGTGLGLSMVQGIVLQSGGAIDVESSVGAGATFTIYLPHSIVTHPPVRSFGERAPSRGAPFETVLVCEDDHDVRLLLVRLLELRGYSVLAAKNGMHALEVAREHPGSVDLLVTDVAMPELGGMELATELRKRCPGLRVLYISGYTKDVEQFSVPLGDDTYFLPKPFLPGDLTHAVSSILEKRASLAPPELIRYAGE
jgi:PAS domain S-box-containing protein